jgi:2-haloacid dehalogenase
MLMAAPKALIFDVFGTVVDWRNGVASVCAEAFAAREINFSPLEFADLWRAEYQPAMQRIRSGNRGYVRLDVLHRENLDTVLAATALGGSFSEGERNALNHAWEQLPPWPDTVEGLQLLKADQLLAPCSNGSIALMARLARFAGLPWDAILGADIARSYKPDLQVYLASVAALGLSPNEVMMVAAHNDDLFAARECGLMTAFVCRPTEYGPEQTTDLGAESDWDFVAETLPHLAGLLNP